MAYSTVGVSSITDIPGAVLDFAAANGYTTNKANGTLSIGSGSTFTLTTSINGYIHLLNVKSSDSRVTQSAQCVSPILSASVTDTTATTQLPSTLFMFTGKKPEQFLAVVIKYGTNLYRHLYIGNMEKSADYASGEVISGAFTRYYYDKGGSSVSYDDYNQFMFSGFNVMSSYTNIANGVDNLVGGVVVDHASNPYPFRAFFWNYEHEWDNVPPRGCAGGYGDGWNDARVDSGRLLVGSQNLLVPINLYISSGSGATGRAMHIGAPSGIRMVNIDNIDPEEVITISSDDWMIFPVFAKSKSSAPIPKASGAFPVAETSFIMGYGYPK